MLQSLDMDLIRASSNLKELPFNWLDTHGMILASGLHLFADSYSAGMIASSSDYSRIQCWGSNPVTDTLGTSSDFTIVHDGLESSRIGKIRAISEWPEGMELLRVCWAGEDSSKNCGQCEKCIRTILSFRAAGVPPKRSFKNDISLLQILRLRSLEKFQIAPLKVICEHLEKSQTKAMWQKALRLCIWKNTIQLYLRNTVTKIRDRLAIRTRMSTLFRLILTSCGIKKTVSDQ